MTTTLKLDFYHLLALAFVSHVSNGYPQFQEAIPNGDRVPHSCKSNYIWHGVGHLADRGGGKLNDFGKEFLHLGKKWSKTLCQLDSDNDGRSNGDELGDPDCTWKPGSICDPFENKICKKQNSWVDCSLDELKCMSIYDEGVKNITLRFPETKVPNNETTYMCTVFDLPSDSDYHVIANKPYIANEFVMHHMLLFGCQENDKVQNMIPNEPHKCQMGTKGCNDIIGLWTVGSAGECAPKDFGFRIGTNGYKRVMLQSHWNNPELKSDYVDSSGLTLYYTSRLRQNDAGVLMVGSVGFELPPGRQEVTVVGTCSKTCSAERFSEPIFVTSALNHMHYLGEKQKIEIIRDGLKIKDITNEEEYSYDRPIKYKFKDHIEILPGDEVKTTCVFKTTSRVNSTFNGPGTNDEMCLGFLTFYPKKNVKQSYCTSWKSLPVCELRKPVLRGCNTQFINISHPEFVDMRTAVKEHCSTNGTCLDSCKHHLSIFKSHPCMTGDVGEYVRLKLKYPRNAAIDEFYHGFDSCNEELFSDCGADCSNTARHITSVFTFLYVCIAVLLSFAIMLL